jgi:hypothetical protein
VGKRLIRRSIDSGASLRVQRAEDQMAGLRGGQRYAGGFHIAHFTDEDHVRILAKNMFERGGKRGRIDRRFRADSPRASLFACTNSMGSSSVMIWDA